MATKSSQMKRNDYVSIRDPKPRDGIHMPTINSYSCGKVFKVNDQLYVTVELPNGVKQKLPRGRIEVLRSEKEYFLHMLKGGMYQ